MNHLTRFQLEDLAVIEGTRWIVSVRPKQVTLGSLLLLPRRAIADFASVSDSESIEAFALLGAIERMVLEKFAAAKINVVAAMMKDPFVHFHIFPRYATALTMFGQVWTDEDWPRAIVLRDIDTTSQTLEEIRDHLLGRK
jgi:diadenosine tetraphosphate (Ap4A) HIT family hydrolase